MFKFLGKTMSGNSECHEGGCTCGHVRYRMTSNPLVVHGCHCTWCQTQSGGAFAVNALIEADRVELLSGSVDKIMTPSPSGEGQQIVRCPECKVAVWSNYQFGGLFDRINFIRVGTLDDPSPMPPDVHIYTCARQKWFDLPKGVPAVDEYYVTEEVWSKDSYARIQQVVAQKAADEAATTEKSNA